MTHLEDFEDDCSPEKPDNVTNDVDVYITASCGKSRVVIDGPDNDDRPPSDAGGGVLVDQDDDGGDPPDPPPPAGPPRPVDPDPCRCYVYDFDILEDQSTLGNTTTFTKTFILYQKCHDFSTGNPENPPETFLWIQDLQHALATGYSGDLNYDGLNSICNCTGPCPTITLVLVRVVTDDDSDGPSTPPGNGPRPRGPSTPGDVQCCLFYCKPDTNTNGRECKTPAEWKAIALAGQTSTKDWACSDVNNATPFTDADGTIYSRDPITECGEPDNGGGGGGGAPGVPGRPTTPPVAPGSPGERGCLYTCENRKVKRECKFVSGTGGWAELAGIDTLKWNDIVLATPFSSGGKTYYRTPPDCGDPTGPTTPDGDSGGGGAGAPGAPDEICSMWFCDGNVARQIQISMSVITAQYPQYKRCSQVPSVITVGEVTYYKSRPPCGGGGGGAPGAPSELCLVWYCEGNKAKSLRLPLTTIAAMSPDTIDINSCSQIPNTFVGTDEITYYKNPPPCGGGGGGAPGAPGGKCRLYYCFENQVEVVFMPFRDVANLSSETLLITSCEDIPPRFEGTDGITYYTTPPPCGGGGGGAPGSPIAPASTQQIGGGFGAPGAPTPFDPFDDGGGGGGGGAGAIGDPGSIANGTLFDPPGGGGGGAGAGAGVGFDGEYLGDANANPFESPTFNSRMTGDDAANTFLQTSNQQATSFDSNNNISFTRDIDRLRFMRAVGNNPLFSDNSVFKREVYQTLATMIKASVGRGIVPYNGEEISAFCFDDEVVTDSLKDVAKDSIDKLNTQNSSSQRFSGYLIKGLRNAIIRSVVEDYTLDFLREIGAGYGEINPEIRSDSQQVAVGYVSQFRKSLYPKNYSKGEDQRRVQMWHALPTDIDLKTTIGVSHGGHVCVRVADTDDFEVISQDGSSVIQVATKNEYYTVSDVNGNERTVSLYSKRKQAYAFDLPKLSVVHSLYGGRGNRFGRNGDYNFILKTETPFEDEVEVSATSTTLKEAYLIKVNKRTIGDAKNDTQHFRQTSCVYDLVWESGGSEEIFTSSVEDYYGPRQIIYINNRDPFWNHFLAASSVSATYNDLKIDGLLGGIYPRVLNMDMLLVPTNQVRFDPYQGNSKLDQYEPNKPVIRSIKVVTSPVQKSLKEVYAQLDFDSRRIARQGGVDNYAVKSIRGFNDGHFKKVAAGDTELRTNRSIVGRFINVINRIKENYNLGGRGRGLSLPQRDLYSFMKPREVAEFLLRIPQSVRNAIINGDFTGVRVFAVTNLDTEKTFLRSSREKVAGVNLDDERLFKEVQNLSSKYFKEIR